MAFTPFAMIANIWRRMIINKTYPAAPYLDVHPLSNW